MEWKNIDKGWKAAFGKAWEAFNENMVPIGCVIQNESDETLVSGINTIFSKESKNMTLYNNQLAHAEINTILLLDEFHQKNVRKYTLYATLEPCILCFGAIVMGNIRFVKFAARDKYGGATSINETHEYTRSKNIQIEGPFEQLEYLQICLFSYYELKNNPEKCEILLSDFEKDCYKGVLIAREFFQNKTLDKYEKEGKNIEYVYNKIIERI